jgi:hypothetical protein
MAYLGKGPSDTFSGVTSKDSFTGDGSTVNFDISTDIPQGGDTDIFVYVDNVRQEPGVSKAYTTGQDGSGNYRRITFTTAPDSGAEIYVLNPGRIEALQVTGDNSVSAAKIQSSAVTTAKINDAAVTTAKLGSAAVTNTNLDTSIITGFTELAEEAAAGDFLIIYDTSTGTLKKIQRSNLTIQVPNVTSISPTNVDSKDSATTTTFTVTGTGFSVGVTAVLISNGGTEISFNTVTRDSATQLTCVLNNALVTAVTDEPYDIKVTNSSGLTNTLTNQINVDQRPVFVTAAGTLGTQRSGSFSATIEATDPESAGAVRYDVVGGTLPTGITLNTSTGVISGSITPESSDTTYNFTIQASDVDSNVSFRDFSITLSGPSYLSFTSSGTFSVPSGITAVDVLVVGGGGGGASSDSTNGSGGGGAGGLIFRPGFPVTPGGTITVTVGCGGGPQGLGNSPGNVGSPSTFGSPGDPGTGTVLTAIRGGHGSVAGAPSPTAPTTNAPGGSGGGGSGPSGGSGIGQGIQPTQPGDSGTYGFGNAGGGNGGALFVTRGGGGGGAGGVGLPGGGCNPFQTGGGGIGRAYTIADGTTPVYYAGGGGSGGGTSSPSPNTTGGPGGQGGGGAGGNFPGSGNNAQANTGGGGGAASARPGQPGATGGAGGKGIVIVSY